MAPVGGEKLPAGSETPSETQRGKKLGGGVGSLKGREATLFYKLFSWVYAAAEGLGFF